jgi:hypothetical protein
LALGAQLPRVSVLPGPQEPLAGVLRAAVGLTLAGASDSTSTARRGVQARFGVPASEGELASSGAGVLSGQGVAQAERDSRALYR